MLIETPGDDDIQGILLPSQDIHDRLPPNPYMDANLLSLKKCLRQCHGLHLLRFGYAKLDRGRVYQDWANYELEFLGSMRLMGCSRAVLEHHYLHAEALYLCHVSVAVDEGQNEIEDSNGLVGFRDFLADLLLRASIVSGVWRGEIYKRNGVSWLPCQFVMTDIFDRAPELPSESSYRSHFAVSSVGIVPQRMPRNPRGSDISMPSVRMLDLRRC